MYKKPIEHIAFVTAHAAGLGNQELASLFDVHISTIKRRKKELALLSNDIRNNLGRQGEQLIAEELTRRGFQVKLMPTGHAFDLLADACRIEVKTSATSLNGSYRFRLNEQRSSNHNQYRYSKDYRRDSDFIMLAVLDSDGIQHLYVLPTKLWKPSIRVRPDSPFCPYAPYHWAVQLLRQAVAA